MVSARAVNLGHIATEIAANAALGSIVMTDDHRGYSGLGKAYATAQ